MANSVTILSETPWWPPSSPLELAAILHARARQGKLVVMVTNSSGSNTAHAQHYRRRRVRKAKWPFTNVLEFDLQRCWCRFEAGISKRELLPEQSIVTPWVNWDAVVLVCDSIHSKGRKSSVVVSVSFRGWYVAMHVYARVATQRLMYGGVFICGCKGAF